MEKTEVFTQMIMLLNEGMSKIRQEISTGEVNPEWEGYEYRKIERLEKTKISLENVWFGFLEKI